MMANWKKRVVAVLLPLMLMASAQAGHRCLSFPSSEAVSSPACCCAESFGNISVPGHERCCGTQDESCRCELETATPQAPVTVVDVRPVVVESALQPLGVVAWINRCVPECGKYIILRDPPPCFATREWRTIRLNR